MHVLNSNVVVSFEKKVVCGLVRKCVTLLSTPHICQNKIPRTEETSSEKEIISAICLVAKLFLPKRMRNDAFKKPQRNKGKIRIIFCSWSKLLPGKKECDAIVNRALNSFSPQIFVSDGDVNKVKCLLCD